MKKILIASALSIFALSMTGCGTSEETKSLNQLYNRVEDAAFVVSGTSSTEVNSVSPIALNNYTSSSLELQKNNSYNNMLREEELRQDVLQMCDFIKGSIKNRCSLSRGQATAIKNLNVSIKRNTNNLEETKEVVKETVAKLNSYKISQTSEKETTYIELDNLMQERALYLSNLQTTMQKVCQILNENCENSSQNENIENESDITNNDQKGIIEKNIDSYNNQISEEKSQETANIEPNNEYYVNPYNNQNNYYSRRFNPNRNTDTFYPRVRNIDTYRFNPYENGYYNSGYYNQPATPAMNIIQDFQKESNLPNKKLDKKSFENIFRKKHKNSKEIHETRQEIEKITTR